MELKIYFVEPIDSNFYELDENGKTIEPDLPISKISEPYYVVEGTTDKYHVEFTKIFETFHEAKEYVDEIGEK